ncbi:hemolysin [Bacillus pseudomycoides]|uniref:Hemolysin III family protein n=1 Tax=Bacillus pseudomycoides TaxID=64104 RepID=A0AAJ1Z2K3_9BACI|nr:hemolysin III family protein [Bacillus pseudomycoides]MBD5795402.1 hemolysin [Bacillus pseudomycoides]MCR8859708.1 hemolysin III family protein [Bacillus pseudomycoides]MDR4327676.1 hemolysin III family protein [Bacillus pseudomycoides]MED1473623.1 hemolysin III family protein [Bacillus pseudomycoides]MED1537574.1 hemolysin III family protein [Bacillus pseudomycoides]
MNTYVREPVNAFTHLGGAILSFIALLAMLVKVSVKMPSISTISAVILFGVGMMILYAASAVYHSVVASERVIYFFRKLDHSMIFILIAGTYAPFCLITLQAANGLLLFVLVYATAICGIVFKMFWFNCPRWLSTAIYLMMGWLIVLFFTPLSENLSIEGILFLVLGGVFYTIGGFIYGAKPKWLEFKYMGHHEVFHIFVLLGSLAHFVCVYCYVI